MLKELYFYSSLPNAVSHPLRRCFSCAVRDSCWGLSQAGCMLQFTSACLSGHYVLQPGWVGTFSLSLALPECFSWDAKLMAVCCTKSGLFLLLWHKIRCTGNIHLKDEKATPSNCLKFSGWLVIVNRCRASFQTKLFQEFMNIQPYSIFF